MDYAKPKYSVQEVNSAGRMLAKLEGTIEELGWAIDVIDNWRASHAYPAQSFYVTLKRRANKVHAQAITAQRIKRLPSIAFKLIHMKDLKLSQMQDVGGCRAVLPSLNQVRKLQQVYEKSDWGHKEINPKDYISYPKDTGYRGVHLKYRFGGKGDKSPYDGLKIEIQLRTNLQHKWATAVEAADTFTKQALKSNKGKKEWHRFFALMSSIFALREKSPLVPGTPITFNELVSEIKQLDSQYHFASMFMGYTTIFPHVEKKSDSKFYLVTLDPVAMTVNVKGFKGRETQLANKEYTEAEKALADDDSATQVVLVSVSSVSALKKAYPNYFLDTKEFLGEVLKVLNSSA